MLADFKYMYAHQINKRMTDIHLNEAWKSYEKNIERRNNAIEEENIKERNKNYRIRFEEVKRERLIKEQDKKRNKELSNNITIKIMNNKKKLNLLLDKVNNSNDELTEICNLSNNIKILTNQLNNYNRRGHFS